RGLEVLGRKRLEEKRVVQQVDLAHREVVGRAPIRVEETELLRRQRLRRTRFRHAGTPFCTLLRTCTGTSMTGTRERSSVARITGARPGASSRAHPRAIRSQWASSATCGMSS